LSSSKAEIPSRFALSVKTPRASGPDKADAVCETTLSFANRRDSMMLKWTENHSFGFALC